jgi:DNA-binding SARP family transcriptional activator/predicted ATPase
VLRRCCEIRIIFETGFSSMPHLIIRLFGLPQFFLDETPLKVERRKTLALLSYLACASEGSSGGSRGVSRETLSALLWPDAAQEQATAYLRQALWDFSKVAGEGWIEREGASMRLRQDEMVRVDVRTFNNHMAYWKRAGQGNIDEDSFSQNAIPLLEEAVSLYTGDFLEGFTLRDSPDFDEWQTLQAEGLRLQLSDALEGLSRLYSLQERYEPAIAAARRWLVLDELNENAHRALMRLYDASGQRSAAIRQYETCQRRLQQELGVAPEPATTQLFQQVSARRNTSPGAQPSGAPKRASDPTQRTAARAPARPPVPVFLPSQATPFLGRENELARIREMLANPECRLVTLVGQGGSGKTRLAIQAAGQSIGYPHGLSYPHGIYFVGLASAVEPDEMVLAIARAIKLELRSNLQQGISSEEAREQMLNFLAEKKILLVLDNLEQINDTGLLSDLLACAPDLKLVATSRIRLNLPEEWVLEVGGLPFPEQNLLAAEIDGEAFQQYAAVQLFIKCAGRAGRFTPQAADLPVIARICQAIEGLPLGVELAAAWVKMLSCQEILAEINRSLDFLETAFPGAPERQRSLRAVFEHSWDLLSENERSVFRQLSIFRGGFTREAAYQVAGASLVLLGAFVDQSMLRRVSSGRFDLHELVKQYAAEKLAADPPAQAETEARHAQYYADWLRQKSELLRGCDQLATLALLRGEMHNLNRAWRWLAAHHQYQQIESILPNIILFYEMHGQYSLGLEIMQVFVQTIRQNAPNGVPQDKTTAGLLAIGLAATHHFDRGHISAEQNALIQQESLALIQGMPPTLTRAFVLLLNSTAQSQLSSEQAIEMCQEAAEIFQSTGDLWGSGLARLVIADVLAFGKRDLEQARAAYESAMHTFDQLDNDWGRALCFFGLASIARMTGRLEEAAQLIQHCIQIYDQMGNIGRLLDTRDFAGRLAAQTGHEELARQYFAANRACSNEIGDRSRSRYYAELIEKLKKD